MNKRILVIGGAGYIGSHMVKMLADLGTSVIVLDNLTTGYADAARYGKLVIGDTADRLLLERLFTEHTFSGVMHFAAFSQVGQSSQHPAMYYRNNVINTMNVLDAITSHGSPPLVFSSTAAVYGEPRQIPIPEAHPLSPINPYGNSKLMVETMLADYERAYGLRWAALRYFNAAGADPAGELGERHNPETHLIPLCLQVAADLRPHLAVYGDDYPTPDGTCIRDYVHVEDICSAHLLALRHLQAGGISRPWNLGNGTGFSVAEVLDTVRAITSAALPFEVVARRPGDPAILVANASDIQQRLGWDPRYPDLETIIRHAWQWMRNTG